jgi:hypothetical protein
MHTLRKLIRELHRRSVWQVLGGYLVGAWLASELVTVLTRFAGLPEWTTRFASILLLIGLPVVLITAVVQKGFPRFAYDPHEAIDPADVVGKTPAEVHVIPGRHPLDDATLFTWRNAVLGGVGAGALLIASVVAYMAMWTMGIGPVGSLTAQGIIQPGERVLLARFNDATGENLGGVVTEMLRVDLQDSPVLRAVAPVELAGLLSGGDGGVTGELTTELALDVAKGEGVPVVIGGAVSRSGSGYLITAKLVESRRGSTLAAFQTQARDLEGIVAAVDALCLKIRERAGESLKSIRAEEPLERSTTASMEGLRYFSEAQDATARGDLIEAVESLESAVVSDQDFALAWRELGPRYEQLGDTVQALSAYRRVMELWTDEDAKGRSIRDLARERIATLGG